MKAFPNLSGGIVRHVGLAAAALLMAVGLHSRPADAVSIASPGAAPSAQHATEALTTQVRGGGGGGGGMHMGGGGMHMGGGGGMHMGGGGGMHFGGGGMHFGGGGFHTFHGGGPVFHGGMHFGGIRHGGFGWHHFHHRRFFGGFFPYYYGDYYPYYYHRCRIIWTHFGPRRICHWPHSYPWLYW